MHRIKRFLGGLHNALERAWADTQVDAPDTVTLAGEAEAEAAEALEAMRHAAPALHAENGAAR